MSEVKKVSQLLFKHKFDNGDEIKVYDDVDIVYSVNISDEKHLIATPSYKVNVKKQVLKDYLDEINRARDLFGRVKGNHPPIEPK